VKEEERRALPAAHKRLEAEPGAELQLAGTAEPRGGWRKRRLAGRQRRRRRRPVDADGVVPEVHVGRARRIKHFGNHVELPATQAETFHQPQVKIEEIRLTELVAFRHHTVDDRAVVVIVRITLLVGPGHRGVRKAGPGNHNAPQPKAPTQVPHRAEL